MEARNVLVAGASGLVGMATVRHFAQQADCKVTAVSRRLPEGLEGADLLSVDLLDEDHCREVFGRMTDVTHLVYAAVNEKPGALVQGWSDREHMRTNLRMLENLFEPLQQAAPGLQHVTLLQGTKAYGAHLGPIPIPARERSPRHQHENFYWLQEDYLRAKQQGKNWTWTILRPQVVIGDAIGSNLNLLSPLGVYAALLREAGEPLHYPGDAGSVVSELVDADLLARAIDWSGTTSSSRNEIFNITNGDVFSMREIWPTIAKAVGMQVGEDRPMLLAEEMPKRAAEWAAIVEKYKLSAPADVHAFVGESFTAADFYLHAGGIGGAAARPVLVSTIKLRHAGFHDCVDTEDMLSSWLHRLQGARLLPPRH